MFKEIQAAKKTISELTYSLSFFKDEARKNKQIEKINSIIMLVNLTERLAAQSVDKNMIDVMLLNLFKTEYMSLQHDGRDGFVSAKDLNLFRQKLGFDFKMGSAAMLDDVSTQMAVDTIANMDILTDDEKAADITKDEKLLKYVGECKNHWSDQLNIFLNFCYKNASYGVIKIR
jgi:hypothetical protein